MRRYYLRDGTPVKCSTCKSFNVRTRAVDRVGSVISEEEYYCGSCGNTLAYWSYGHFDTEIPEEELCQTELT